MCGFHRYFVEDELKQMKPIVKQNEYDNQQKDCIPLGIWYENNKTNWVVAIWT